MVVVRQKSPYYEKSDATIIERALSILGIPGTATLYLAREDWDRCKNFVFDVFHASYNFDTAHQAVEVTVIMVTLGGKKDSKWLANPILKTQVNEQIAELHESNGWKNQPPFFVNRAGGAIPMYESPRSIQTVHT